MLHAIERAYEVFSKYRLVGTINVCDCETCLGKDVQHRLLTTPLRKIEADLLAAYSHAAKPREPGLLSPSLRYFLPRYFELIAKNDWPVHFGEEGALKMLPQADYRRTWLEAEIEAIDRYFGALFRATLFRPTKVIDDAYSLSDVCVAGRILELIVVADGKIAPRLKDWAETDGRTADVQLALLVESSRVGLMKKRRLGSGYWSHARDAEKLVIDWLLNPATRDRLEAAFHREKEKTLQAIISNAHGLIAALIR